MQLVRVHPLPVFVLRRPDHDFVGVGIEPGPPEAEGGIGADVVAAAAHELNIVKTVRSGIPVHDGIPVAAIVIPGVGGVVGKQIEVRVREAFQHVADSPVVVGFRTDSAEKGRILGIQIIPPADVDADRYFALHLFHCKTIFPRARFRLNRFAFLSVFFNIFTILRKRFVSKNTI